MKYMIFTKLQRFSPPHIRRRGALKSGWLLLRKKNNAKCMHTGTRMSKVGFNLSLQFVVLHSKV